MWNQRKLKFIAMPSELGAGTRGASLGPEAVRIAAVKKDKEGIFNGIPYERIDSTNDDFFRDYPQAFAKRGEFVASACESLCEAVRKNLEAGYFTWVFSGDHSNAAGSIAGVKAAFPKQRLGVVWIDAHADLHSPFTTPSGNMHGMPLAASLALDNKDVQRNEICSESEKAWDRMKNLGGIQPKFNTEDLVFVAVRDTEAQEDYLINKFNIRNFTTNEVDRSGVEKVAAQILSCLSACEKIYITFDIDSLEAAMVHGTGTPVENGLGMTQAASLMKELLKDERVCCLEFTEINPLLDYHNQVAELGLMVMEKLLEG